ncbi:HNH endonuclease [Polynucleobacter sp. Latsch14-2]|uniref:HNH endonuclease n=1 Tax=Polynucleobacter sp. Latsch14-2 TaxID=2576920 RepID=UPI001C0D11B8|nr:HNH endonuclease [Polynucleobacter sp. Latsch14-2]MBU3615442.1 HNH endonuclease [Polynucleobacter sp. Latsch14-2]
MQDQFISHFSENSIFTLINERDRQKAESNNGESSILEGKPWTSAKKDFDALEQNQEMILLFGDANRIQETGSIEWFALIKKIKITYDPSNSRKGKTKVFFTGLTRLEKPYPLSRLKLRSKGREGEYFSPHFQRPYALCLLPRNFATFVKSNHDKKNKSSNKPPKNLAHIDLLTENDFLRALQAIEPNMTEHQIEMLVGHANAPSHCLSMRKLAELGGYKNYRVGNLQYGRLGGLFANYFKVDKLPNQTQALAIVGGSRDEFGEFQWKLREPLIQALRSHWSDVVFQSSEVEQTEFEFIKQPDGSVLKPTEQAAIIQSRIGQGLYRKNMLELWGGKCALTGCDIPEVLIASHAKPWKLSTNQERLDKYNGLLLAAHVDALFDTGLISFGDDGALIKSPQLTKAQINSLGLCEFTKLRFIKAEHRRYLKEHRTLHGLIS